MLVGCSGGVAEYGLNAVTFTDDSGVVSGVNPGDTVTTTETETPSNTVTTVTDTTTGATTTASDGRGDASGNPSYQAVVGLFEDSRTVPQFTTIQFRKVTFNGQSLAQVGATPVDLASGSDLQVRTSPLSPNGSIFHLTFRHVS